MFCWLFCSLFFYVKQLKWAILWAVCCPVHRSKNQYFESSLWQSVCADKMRLNVIPTQPEAGVFMSANPNTPGGIYCPLVDWHSLERHAMSCHVTAGIAARQVNFWWASKRWGCGASVSLLNAACLLFLGFPSRRSEICCGFKQFSATTTLVVRLTAKPQKPVHSLSALVLSPGFVTRS